MSSDVVLIALVVVVGWFLYLCSSRVSRNHGLCDGLKGHGSTRDEEGYSIVSLRRWLSIDVSG
eukprot:scaffold2927_cov184-Alexandrium_tamarense.AAC.7